MKLILVVDGHSESRNRVTKTLTNAGYDVLSAESGIQALELAPQVRPDLVLLAIVMPELDGLQTAAQLRKIPDYEKVQIFLLSWVPPLGIDAEPLSRLVNGYLSFETSQDELLAFVERQTQQVEVGRDPKIPL